MQRFSGSRVLGISSAQCRFCSGASPLSKKELLARRVSRPRGTHDLLPLQCLHFRFVEDTFRILCDASDFHEVRTPVLEDIKLFQSSLGPTSDVLMKEMFTVPQSEDLTLALRPENTAGIVRAVIDAGGVHALGPSAGRLFYCGPMFRHERPQRGRYRQFGQLGVELVGHKAALDGIADVEVVFLAHSLLQKLGLRHLTTLQLNYLGDLATRTNYKEALRAFLEPIKDQLSALSQKRLSLGHELRILDSQDSADLKALSQGCPEIFSFYDASTAHQFERIQNGLKALNIPFKLNPRLVRGLDYYTGIAFEFVETEHKGRQGTVLAGGRYDQLFRQLGGDSAAGVGWAAGVERLVLLREAHDLAVPSSSKGPVVVVGITNKENNGLNDDRIRWHCLSVAQSLRNAGLPVVFSPHHAVKQQFHQADKLNATHCVVIGETELSGDIVGLKDMRTKTQLSIPLPRLEAAIRSSLSLQPITICKPAQDS